MNSFIRTASGLSLVVNKKPYTVAEDHPNYRAIVSSLRQGKWDDIPALIDQTAVYVDYFTTDTNELSIDLTTGEVKFRGHAVNPSVSTHILKMKREGFDVKPIERYLANLYNNPSNKAINQLYDWQAANGFTITEDGYLLAYKRVRDDYRSFFDGSTMNTVGTVVSMPRNAVDDRSEVTCSHGLHFCAHSYLSEYCGGKGRILILKINPADVVSIPNDYNNAKGRACSYLILDELVNTARTAVETTPVLTQPVVANTEVLNADEQRKQSYRAGYTDGRGHKAKRYPKNTAYEQGYADGRAKSPNVYATSTEQPELVVLEVSTKDAVFTVVRKLISDITGVEVDPHYDLRNLDLDSLDFIEIVLAVEDEFGIDISDEVAEGCRTAADIVNVVRTIRGY